MACRLSSVAIQFDTRINGAHRMTIIFNSVPMGLCIHCTAHHSLTFDETQDTQNTHQFCLHLLVFLFRQYFPKLHQWLFIFTSGCINAMHSYVTIDLMVMHKMHHAIPTLFALSNPIKCMGNQPRSMMLMCSCLCLSLLTSDFSGKLII